MGVCSMRHYIQCMSVFCSHAAGVRRTLHRFGFPLFSAQSDPPVAIASHHVVGLSLEAPMWRLRTACAAVAALLTVAACAAEPAVAALRKRAEEGDASAQYQLAVAFDKGRGVPLNRVESIKWLLKAAENGNADAQNMLGCCYYSGVSVPQDYTEAVKWFRKAAEQGLAAGQRFLGHAYHTARGVPQDYAEAVKWFRKAAEQGDASAQTGLGFAYDHGQGVPQDYAEAIKWYRKAAELGDATAQTNLGYAYETGQGVPRDYAAAVKWYLKAAAQGDVNAQNKLGNAYAKGLGVPKNRAEAAKWQRLAAAQGQTATPGKRSNTLLTAPEKHNKQDCVPAMEVVQHPENYAGQHIVVYGRVTQAVKGMSETDYVLLNGACRCHFPRGAKAYERLRQAINSEVFISGTAVGHHHVTTAADMIDCEITL